MKGMRKTIKEQEDKIAELERQMGKFKICLKIRQGPLEAVVSFSQRPRHHRGSLQSLQKK